MPDTLPVVTPLLALQMRMAAYLLQPDAQAAMAVADVGDAGDVDDVPGDAHGRAFGSPTARYRLGIYHAAYRARLLETLRDTFGHTLRLLGDERFDALALAHIEAVPSTRGNLRWFGADWPQGLVDSAGADVAELAQLDWALREAFDGPDDTAIGLSDVRSVPPEAWPDTRLRPHATARCLSMRHNTLQRWHALDDGREPPPAEALSEAGWVLVWRRDERPHFRSLSVHEAWTLRALGQGRSWGEVCDGLAETWPELDVAAVAAPCLRRWLTEGVLADVTWPADSA